MALKEKGRDFIDPVVNVLETPNYNPSKKTIVS